MLPEARVVHQLPGRLRLSVPGMRGDTAFFEAATAALRTLPAVRAVRASARSASLLLLHRGLELVELERFATERRLFSVRLEHYSVPGTVNQAGAALDEGIRRLSGEQAGLRAATGGALLTLALIQALRGRILVPATTYLFLALAVLGRDIGPGSDDGPA